MLGRAKDESRPSENAKVVFNLCLCRTVISALVLMVGTIAAVAQPHPRGGATKAERPIGFDIPAQPLTSALDAYAAATGLEALYDSDLAAGRRSTVVSGVLVPDVALRVLLEGTGLTVLYTENAFAVVPMSSNQQGNGRGLDHLPYLAIVQGRIERAFCQHPETMPGQYRVALRFRIGTSGEVLHPELLGKTGDLQRDGMIADLLRNLSIGRSPPPGMPQPVIMIVSPRPPALTGDCGVGESRSPQRAAR